MLCYCFGVKFKFDWDVASVTFVTPKIFKFINLNYGFCHVISYLPNILIYLDYDS